MKKATFFKITFLVAMFLFVRGNISAATYTYTFTAQVYSAYDTQSLGGVDWTAAATGHTTLAFGFDAAGAKGQQFGLSTTASAIPTALSLTTSGITGTISSVMIRTAGSNPAGTTFSATVSVSVGGVSFTSNGNTAVPMTGNNVNLTFVGSGTGPIVISWSQPETKRAIFIKTIEVTNDVTTGIANVQKVLSVTASNGVLTFVANEGEKAQIYNALGKKILSKTLIQGTNTIELSQHGLFIVQVGNQRLKVVL